MSSSSTLLSNHVLILTLNNYINFVLTCDFLKPETGCRYEEQAIAVTVTIDVF